MYRQKIEDVKIVMNGAGAAGTAIARLLLEAGARHLTILASKGFDDNGRLKPG